MDALLDICSQAETADGTIKLIKDILDNIKKKYQDLSASGFRVLGVAYKNGDRNHNFSRLDEKDMIFIGFTTLFDPLKKDVTQTIVNLNRRGVQLKIITGDNALVAASLAKANARQFPGVFIYFSIRVASERPAALAKR